MITKIELGNGFQFLNVRDVVETHFDDSAKKYKELKIVIFNTSGNLMTTNDVSHAFTDAALSSIKIFRKDILNVEELKLAASIQANLTLSIRDITPIYADEKIYLNSTDYNKVYRISDDTSTGEITIILRTDEINISDLKYQELKSENENLTLLLAAAIGGEF